MSNEQTGGPAFPHHIVCENGWAETQKLQGMTLRDYFAAKAMPAVYTEYCEDARATGFDEGWIDGVAHDAYAMADAMLKARDA